VRGNGKVPKVVMREGWSQQCESRSGTPVVSIPGNATAWHYVRYWYNSKTRSHHQHQYLMLMKSYHTMKQNTTDMQSREHPRSRGHKCDTNIGIATNFAVGMHSIFTW